MIKLFFIAATMFLPTAALAAQVSVVAEPERVGVGDVVLVSVRVDADAALNAFSGMLEYPRERFDLVGISDGGSIASVWLLPPQDDGGAVRFTGFTPGGYAGRGGALFGILLRAKSPGDARIGVRSLELLRHDGIGTKEEARTSDLVLAVAQEPLGGYQEPADVAPPELMVERGKSQDEVVFAAVDKGSGLARYEVAERRFGVFGGGWAEATSPYAIKDKRGVSAVYVKAIDRAGNEAVSIYPHRRLFTPYEWGAIAAILALCISYSFLRRRSS